MSSITRNLIKQKIEKLILFMVKFMPLISCSLVDYFTESLYTKCLTENIRKEIESIGYGNVIEMIFNNKFSDNAPCLTEYLQECKTNFLYNQTEICLNIDRLYKELHKYDCNPINGLKLNVFMKPKKSHEVEILSAISASVHEMCNTSHIVDIGDGKGYLSSMLALQYKIPILGIDSSLINTNSAVKRVEKLQKIWHGITKNANRSVLPRHEEKRSTNGDLYKQITDYVDNETDLKNLVGNIFLQPCTKIGLVGLHTCGNLGSTSVRLFNENAYIKSLCNISCCYHLLNTNESISSELSVTAGFPMSEFLCSKNFKLSRAARMLSAQSIDRIIHHKQLPKHTIFYRAILQVLLKSHCVQNELPDNINVGRLRKNFNSFLDYYNAASKKLQIQLNLTEKEVEEFFTFYQNKHEEIDVFNLLRCMLAPLVESMILLDRLLYLHEQGVDDSFLVQLFDPIISPRCYGIIAFKK